jgi:hypothetical protein
MFPKPPQISRMPDTFTEEIKTRVPRALKKALKKDARARGLGSRGLSIVVRDAFTLYIQLNEAKVNGHRLNRKRTRPRAR